MSKPDSEHVLYLAIIGFGVVGSAFIQQLVDGCIPHPVEIIAISDSRSMLICTDKDFTILPSQIKATLKDYTSPTASIYGIHYALSLFVKHHPGRVVLVDNSSSDSVAETYPRFLDDGIHVVTPNKKGISGNLDAYTRVMAAAGAGRGLLFNEATVGAGLPIISTLRDLVRTGDKVKKIEGVFSGTLSYIFNEYSKGSVGGPSFSSIVKIAKENGYTEPHPADDLKGTDVARKLTILSRMIPGMLDHLPYGYGSVERTSLAPDGLRFADADEFVERLPDYDAEMAAKRDGAAKRGNVLRYVGVIDVEQRKVEAALGEYPKTHAFATSLQGSDNIIAFYTERYGARPLLIQGAGAGGAVTAMGVWSDVLKLV